MKRNKNIDYLRACAILVIVVFHCYAVAGGPWQKYRIIHALMNFSGELGVTLFFGLSGFGIFWSLYGKEKNNKMPGWGVFIKQRCVRIVPQYYACIFVLLIFQLVGLIGGTGVKHIVAYATFTQNFFVETHGSINGALWTMATIFQFYLIAIFLYRKIQKNCLLSGIAALAVSVLGKFVMYHYVIPGLQLGDYAYFVYGRGIVTAIDNFVFGMIAAKIVLKIWEHGIDHKKMVVGLVGVCISLTGLLAFSYWFYIKGIYADTVTGYVAHSILAALWGCIIICLSLLPQLEWRILKPFEFVAKYQYGIYLWHLPVIKNLYNGSPLFQNLIARGFVWFALGVLIIVIPMGYFSTVWIDGKHN